MICDVTNDSGVNASLELFFSIPPFSVETLIKQLITLKITINDRYHIMIFFD